MKAFENHLTKDYPYVRPTSVDAEIMRQEWRAALEFVKSEIFEHHEVLDVIEQELEE